MTEAPAQGLDTPRACAAVRAPWEGPAGVAAAVDAAAGTVRVSQRDRVRHHAPPLLRRWDSAPRA